MDSFQSHPHSGSTGTFSWDRQQPAPSPFSVSEAHDAKLARETWGSVPFDIPAVASAKRADYRGPLLEVMVTWGNSVLHVAHVPPYQGFILGEAAEGLPVDLALSSDIIGRSQLPLVECEGDVIYAVIPEGMDGQVSQGKSKISLRELLSGAPNCATIARAQRQRLGADMRVEIELPQVTVSLGLVSQSQPLPGGLFSSWDYRVLSAFGLSVGVAGALMTSLAFFTPPLGLEDEGALDEKRLLAISHYMDALSEKEKQQEQAQQEEASGADGGAEAKRAEGEEGEAGKENTPRLNKQAAVAGPRENTQLQLSNRAQLLEEVRTTGMVGMLIAAQASDPNAPTSIFGRDSALGNSDLSANGNMWGDSIGESGGMGGLGLSGAGFGGGALLGSGLGIGRGEIGTIGGGTGKDGMGLSRGPSGGTHEAKSPRIKLTGKTEVSGRIPPQVIQRVVRQNFGRFRMCYEQGLARNPNLEGRVQVRFIIGSDGMVSSVSGGGDIPDGGVKSCVANAFYGISFPPPDGGTVKVSYPLMFSPE